MIVVTSTNANYGKHKYYYNNQNHNSLMTCVINNHLVTVTVGDLIFIKTKVVIIGYYYGVEHQLKLDAKCKLEDEAITMVLFKRFKHFWHQIEAMIVTFVMVQFAVQIIEILQAN